MKSLISFLLTIYKGLTEREPYFKELVSDYEDYYTTSKISPLSILRANLISKMVEPYSSILDVGCGEGFLMEFLFSTKKCKVHGIDVSKKAIEIVRSKGFEGVVRDIDEKGLGLSENEKYDYILFIEVLEHLKYPHKVLIEACKHVKKGIIVSLPNTGYIYWRLQMLRGYSPRQSFTHLHFWSINDFYIFLKQLHLKPLALKTDLPDKGIKGKICEILKNLLAYQQCWLIAPL
jgi:methionine biosynthesis protein MetW